MDAIALFQKYRGPGRRSGRGYVFPCWRCDPPSRHKRGHLYVDPSTGFYSCLKCKNNPDGLGHGHAMKFAKMMGDGNLTSSNIELRPEEPKNFEVNKARAVYHWAVKHAELRAEHREYLKGRGVLNPDLYELKSTDGIGDRLRENFPEDFLLASGLFYKHDETGQIMRAGVIQSGRVIIPYRKGSEIKYLRTRNVDGPCQKPYLGPREAKANYYFWGEIHKVRQFDLIVTEGEFKALSAHHYGFHILALPGMNSAHGAVAKACKASGTRQVTICFDSQKDTKIAADVDIAAGGLARRLKSLSPGIRVFRARLPLVPFIKDGLKMDIDDYIRTHGVNAFKDVMDAAEEMEVGLEARGCAA